MIKPNKYFFNKEVNWCPKNLNELELMNEKGLKILRSKFISNTDWELSEKENIVEDLMKYLFELDMYINIRYSDISKFSRSIDRHESDILEEEINNLIYSIKNKYKKCLELNTFIKGVEVDKYLV